MGEPKDPGQVIRGSNWPPTPRAHRPRPHRAGGCPFTQHWTGHWGPHVQAQRGSGKAAQVDLRDWSLLLSLLHPAGIGWRTCTCSGSILPTAQCCRFILMAERVRADSCLCLGLRVTAAVIHLL